MSKPNKYSLENVEAQMRKGSLEFTILLIISRGEVYASDIIQQLKTHDLIVVEGTLYPILSRLNRAGLLDYSWVESESGPPRKYYSLTKTGKESLDQMTAAWKAMSASIQQLITNAKSD
ncbi:MAG: PadR family transcriptional regulator [Balneolaceae bacterium]